VYVEAIFINLLVLSIYIGYLVLSQT